MTWFWKLMLKIDWLARHIGYMVLSIIVGFIIFSIPVDFSRFNTMWTIVIDVNTNR